ncbi:DUF2970 domain-containing protein [Isoalcanivorax indicus]|uniref:DUF2970 domain-containing protein n=1 Tax=Isoalcanivorax indicus TaxID=2202653 RepID=UPI000DB91F48|nr:DUF2970 domain-containing protein [Isoalcanivorax indicus]
MNEHRQEHDQEEQDKPNVFQVIWSVLAALFGVQSGRNRERDFRQGKASDYIIVYVFLVVALVVGMILTVNIVLSGT